MGTDKPVKNVHQQTTEVSDEPRYPNSIQDQLYNLNKPKDKPHKTTGAPKNPNDYYAVIPYKDINKLFDLLNKHVKEPVKYKPPKKEKKKDNKNPIKTRITH